jgi:hypothetical protein
MDSIFLTVCAATSVHIFTRTLTHFEQKPGAPTTSLQAGDLPPCLASGHYLLCAELYTLDQAGPDGGGTQHFLSCAQLNVVKGGSWTGSSHVKFPGELSLSDKVLCAEISYLNLYL